jgi:hypothetical protein
MSKQKSMDEKSVSPA